MLQKALFFYRDGTFEIMEVHLKESGEFYENYRIAKEGESEIIVDFHRIWPFGYDSHPFPAYLEPIDEKDSTLFGHSWLGLRKTLRDALNRA